MASSLENTDRGSRRQLLVQEVLSEFFEGRFTPGERLRVEHLAERFGVSATPVREALVELAGIGVAELQPNRGAVLRPFGPRQLREIYQVRRMLECEAARCACGRIAPFELKLLKDGLEGLIHAPRGPKWSTETRRLDTQLHDLIAERCGSNQLAHELGRYATLYRTLRDARHRKRTARVNYAQMEENREHLAIVEALLSGDGEAAAVAMAAHLNEAAAALEQDIFSREAIELDRAEPFLYVPAQASR